MKSQHATYKVFFGFEKEPFGQDVRVEDLMKSNAVMGVKERFLYAVGLGAVVVITGDVGSGKSSALGSADNSCKDRLVSSGGGIWRLWDLRR